MTLKIVNVNENTFYFFLNKYITNYSPNYNLKNNKINYINKMYNIKFTKFSLKVENVI